MTNIFVFGSNLAGRHGAGAALTALRYYGAIYGQGEGLQGNSYGIPTKDKYIKTLPLTEIHLAVTRFLEFAAENQHLIFNVTKIGCGLAGYSPHQIAPFFRNHTENVLLPDEFRDLLNSK